MTLNESGRTAGLMSFLSALLVTACGVPANTASLETVSDAISVRTARGVPTSLESVDDCAVPADVDLNDGIDEEEAVAIALWREPELAAALASLEVARADVITAGELPNPRVLVLFPYGAKLGEGALSLVLDSLITRSSRVEKAQFDAAALADGLVTHGLDLAHRVRTSFTLLRTLRRRLALTTAAEVVAARLGEISVARVRAGVATESEVATEASALGLLRDDARTIQMEIERCALGLSSLLRCEPWLEASAFVETMGDADLPFDPRALESCALRTRPELSAKRFEIDATLEREGLALADIIKIRGILDVNQKRVESSGSGGDGKSRTHVEYEAGPGVEVDLPVFNWSKGARAAAAATFERQKLELRAIESRVALEVRDARLQLEYATTALRGWQAEQVVNLETTVGDASARFAHGAASEAQVLLAKRALLEARRREIDLQGLRRQAQVDLSRAVGCRLDRPLIAELSEIES
ncbi:MAG: TolC family protein [Planctomycetes bacterium]|nr:TolC family protein [Planctomycetota bacterium]